MDAEAPAPFWAGCSAGLKTGLAQGSYLRQARFLALLLLRLLPGLRLTAASRIDRLLQNAFHGGQDALAGAGGPRHGVHALNALLFQDGGGHARLSLAKVFALLAGTVFGG